MEKNTDSLQPGSTPPMGSFTAWYVLLIVVLIVEIIFFSWLTKTYA
jgi:hypothetical protein